MTDCMITTWTRSSLWRWRPSTALWCTRNYSGRCVCGCTPLSLTRNSASCVTVACMRLLWPVSRTARICHSAAAPGVQYVWRRRCDVSRDDRQCVLPRARLTGVSQMCTCKSIGVTWCCAAQAGAHDAGETFLALLAGAPCCGCTLCLSHSELASSGDRERTRSRQHGPVQQGQVSAACCLRSWSTGLLIDWSWLLFYSLTCSPRPEPKFVLAGPCMVLTSPSWRPPSWLWLVWLSAWTSCSCLAPYPSSPWLGARTGRGSDTVLLSTR